MFDSNSSTARRLYREFVANGVDQGRRDDLIGGVLIRSAGGWLAVKVLCKAKRFQKSDERVLGDGEFVEKVLSLAAEKMMRRWGLFPRCKLTLRSARTHTPSPPAAGSPDRPGSAAAWS